MTLPIGAFTKPRREGSMLESSGRLAGRRAGRDMMKSVEQERVTLHPRARVRPRTKRVGTSMGATGRGTFLNGAKRHFRLPKPG